MSGVWKFADFVDPMYVLVLVYRSLVLLPFFILSPGNVFLRPGE